MLPRLRVQGAREKKQRRALEIPRPPSYQAQGTAAETCDEQHQDLSLGLVAGRGPNFRVRPGPRAPTLDSKPYFQGMGWRGNRTIKQAAEVCGRNFGLC